MSSPRTIALVLALLIVPGAWLAFRRGPEPRRADAQPAAEALPAVDPLARPLPPMDRAKRDAMRARIYATLGRPPPSSERPSKETSRADGGIEPEWSHGLRQQLFDVAFKCAKDALTTTNPDLTGEMDLSFVLVGDRSVGGIVEAVDVLDKSTLRDPNVIRCVRESFLGATFAPPRGSGATTEELTFSLGAWAPVKRP